MGKNTDVPLKEKYRLFYEYLKRSDNFSRIEAGVNDPIAKRKTFIEVRSKGLFGYFFFRELLWLHPSFDTWWDNEIEQRKISDKVGVEDITEAIDKDRRFYYSLPKGRSAGVY